MKIRKQIFFAAALMALSFPLLAGAISTYQNSLRIDYLVSASGEKNVLKPGEMVTVSGLGINSSVKVMFKGEYAPTGVSLTESNGTFGFTVPTNVYNGSYYAYLVDAYGMTSDKLSITIASAQNQPTYTDKKIYNTIETTKVKELPPASSLTSDEKQKEINKIQILIMQLLQQLILLLQQQNAQ